MPKNKVNSPVLVYNVSRLSLKHQYHFSTHLHVKCISATDHGERIRYPVPEGMFGKQIGRTDELTVTQ